MTTNLLQMYMTWLWMEPMNLQLLLTQTKIKETKKPLPKKCWADIIRIRVGPNSTPTKPAYKVRTAPLINTCSNFISSNVRLFNTSLTLRTGHLEHDPSGLMVVTKQHGAQRILDRLCYHIRIQVRSNLIPIKPTYRVRVVQLINTCSDLIQFLN